MEVAKLFFSLEAQTSNMVSELASAKSAISSFATSSASLIKLALLGAFLAVGAAMLKFAGDAIGAARSFESAWAGVVKTNEGLVDSFGNLTDIGKDMQQGFRDLAKEIPISVEELLALGEAGGQLGVAQEDLLAFTETMAQLGVTTNLTSEEAATAFARLGNVMGLSQEDITRMASSVVALGNNFATTEADIVSFAQNIAGAAAIAGLTASDVAAIGAAFSSVGIEAGAGGTAVQKVLLGINTSIVTGSDDLQLYADTAGMTAAEFADAWENDAGAAFTTFVEGLGVAGDDAILVLEELGLTDARLIKAFLSLANAGDLLGDAMELSNQAFKDNTALAAEAEVRFGTVDSKVQLLKNTFNDLLLVVGLPLLDAFGALIEATTGIVDGVTTFFGAVQQGVGPVEALRMALTGLIPQNVVDTIINVISAIGAFLAPLGELITKFVTWKDAVTALGLIIASMLLPFLPVVISLIGSIVVALAPVILIFAAVTAAVAALRYAWENNFLGIRDIIDRVREAFQFLVTAISFNGLADVFTVFEDGSSVLQSFLEKLGFGEETANSFATVVIEGVTELGVIWETVFTALKTAGDGFWTALQTLGTGIGQLLSGDFEGALTTFQTAWTTGWTTITDFVGTIGGLVITKLGEMWTSLTTWFNEQDWAGIAQTAWDTLVTGFGDLWLTVSTKLTEFWTSLTTWWTERAWAEQVTNAWNDLVTGFGDLWLIVQPKLAAFWISVTTWFNALDWQGRLTGASEKIAGGLTDLWGAIQPKFAALLTSIETWFTSIPWATYGQQAMETLRNAFTGLGETLGTTLATALTSLGTFLSGVDWASIGSAIINGIITGIGAVAGLLIAGWVLMFDLIVGFATGADWVSVATSIVTGIANALIGLVSGIADALVQWYGVFTTWASSQDWNAIGQTIIDFIIDAMNQWNALVDSVLLGWYNTFVTWVGSQDWEAIGQSIVDFITDALTAGVTYITDAISAWKDSAVEGAEDMGNSILETIEDKLTELADNMLQWGTDAVTSLVEGLQTFATDGLTAITDGIQAIQDYWNNIDWYQLGFDVAFAIASGLKNFATEAAAIVEGWGESLDSFFYDTDWEGKANDLIDKIATGLSNFASDIASTIEGWGEALDSFFYDTDWEGKANDIIEDIKVALSAFATSIQETVEGWGASMDEFFFEKDWEAEGEKVTTGIETALTAFLTTIGETVTGWYNRFVTEFTSSTNDWAGLGESILEGIGQGILDYADNLYESIKGVAAGIRAAFSGEIEEGSPARAFIPSGIAIDQGIAVGIEDGSSIPIGAITDVAADLDVAGAKAFGDAISSIAASIEPAMNAMMAILGFDTSGAEQGFANIKRFADLVGAFVNVFAGVASTLKANSAGYALDEAEEMASATKAVSSAILDAIGALTTLAGFNVPNVQPKMVALANQISIIVNNISIIAERFGAETLAHVSYFTEVAQEVIGLIQPGIEAVSALSDLQITGDPVGNMGGLAHVLRLIVEITASMAGFFTGQVLAAISLFSSAAQQAIELIEPGIEAVGALSNLQIIGDPVGNMQGLAHVLRLIMSTIESMAGFFTEDVLTHITTFTDAAQQAIELIEPGIEAVSALSELEIIGDPVGNMAQLAVIIQSIVQSLADISASFSGEVLVHVSTFTETAKSALELLVQAQEALDALGNLVWPEGDIQAMLNQIVALVSLVIDLFTIAAEGLSGEAIAAIDLFTQAANDVLDTVILGVEAITSLASLSGIEVAQSEIQNFIDLLIETVNGLVLGLDESGLLANEALVASADASASLKAIIEIIKPGVDALVSIVGFSGITLAQSAVDSFVANLVMVVEFLNKGIANSGLVLSEALTETAAVAELMKKLISVIEPGVKAMIGINTASNITLADEQITNFITQLVRIVIALKDGIANSSGLIGEALGVAALVADDMKEVVALIKPGVDALKSIGEFVGVDLADSVIANFVASLIRVVIALKDGIANADGLIGQALLTAAAASENINKVVGLIKPGIDALAAIATFVGIDGLDGIIAGFVSQLIQVVTALVEGLQKATEDMGIAIEFAGYTAEHMIAVLAIVKPGIDAIKALAEFVVAADIATQAGLFITTLTLVTQVLVDGLKRAAKQIGIEAVASATEFANAILTLSTAVQSALENINTIATLPQPDLAGFGDWLTAQAQSLSDALIAAHAALGTNGVTIANEFKQALQAILGALQGALEVMATVIGSNSGSTLQNLLDEMLQAMQATANPAQIEGVRIGEQFGIGLTGTIEEYLGGLENLMDDLVSILEDTASDAENAGTIIGEAFGEGLQSAVENAVETTTDFLITGLSEAGSLGMEAATDAVVSETPNFVNAFTDAGQLAIEALANSLQNTAPVQAAVQSLINDIIGAFSNAPNEMYNIGQYMIEGFTNAIYAGQSQVIAAMSDTMNASIQSAEDTLGIASPSKVFQEIGEFALRGLAKAFKNTRSVEMDIAKSIGAIITASDKAFNPRTPSFAGMNAGRQSNAGSIDKSSVVNNTYNIISPVPISSEGDVVANIRGLRLLG